jgi:hypothetical protein
MSSSSTRCAKCGELLSDGDRVANVSVGVRGSLTESVPGDGFHERCYKLAVGTEDYIMDILREQAKVDPK